MASPYSSNLSICTLLYSESLSLRLSQTLQGDSSACVPGDRIALTQFTEANEFLQLLQLPQFSVDCLIIQDGPQLLTVLKQLQERSLWLPTVILQDNRPAADDVSTATSEMAQSEQSLDQFYHNAILPVAIIQLDQICFFIDEAIDKFLRLSATGNLLGHESTLDPLTALATHRSLLQQHKRLTEKLRERLGYLGIYYKRNSDHFLRNMTEREKQDLLQQLKADYRQIILRYFVKDSSLNQRIDNFVNLAFFADVPVAQIVEIHMELMDEFSKQLKLEGRSDEVLLDYRLTLIDTIAHLCEMYRRSIPRESQKTENPN
jgi:circadian clock protein KaiA